MEYEKPSANFGWCVTRELEQAYFRHIIDQKFMWLYFRNISPETLGIAPFSQAILSAEFMKGRGMMMSVKRLSPDDYDEHA